MHVLATDAGRRSLSLLLLGLIVAVASWLVLCMNLPCVAAAPVGSHDRRGISIDEGFDEDEDEDDWGFMSDDAVLGLSQQQHGGDQAAAKTVAACALSLPLDQVNDDYCDCEDGTDEPNTSACSHLLLRPAGSKRATGLQFNCKADEKQIAVNFINDGLCDCCDGSDESDGMCANTCETEWKTSLQEIKKRLQTVRDGDEIRRAYAAGAVEKVKKLAANFERLQQSFAAGQRAFEDLQRRVQDNPELQPQLEQSYHVLRTVQYIAYIQSRVVDVGTFSDAVWKPAFAELVGQCFPFTDNEKQLKGGTPNVIPREYVMVFCPFQNATQTEPSYPMWARAERETKTGISSGEDEEVPRAITLGVWNEWLMEDKDRPGFVRAQEYNHGEPCANDQERQVRVEFVCGINNRVLSAEEATMCVYEFQFETPAACGAVEEQELLDRIAQIELLLDVKQQQREVHEEL